MPDLKIFTIADLQSWLIENRTIAGLSRQIIAPSRAWAIINNPYIQKDDPIIAAIYVEDEIAAYTTAFPELINDQRLWWFSSLWCDSKFRGRGFGIIVISCLAEIYGIDHCLDRWGSQETIEIFTYLGLETSFSRRYYLGSKINQHTVKGKTIQFLLSFQRGLQRMIKHPKKIQENYALRYLPMIDNNTYAFILSHRNSDFFLHSQEMLNWELQFPFTISSPCINRTLQSTCFPKSELLETRLFAVQVLDNEVTIGFYMMKKNDGCLHILYLYYTNDSKLIVFDSIKEHVNRMHISQFVTENEELVAYIQEHECFSKSRVIDISFSCPRSFLSLTAKSMQYGDGDVFTISD